MAVAVRPLRHHTPAPRLTDARPTEGYVEFLETVPLFGGMDRVARAKLAAHLDPVAVKVGDEVFREGDVGDALYLIREGKFKVLQESRGGGLPVLLSTLRSGESLGEMSLLSASPRSATVVAETDGALLRLDRTTFLKLLRSDGSLGLALMSVLSERLREADARLTSHAGHKVHGQPHHKHGRKRSHKKKLDARPALEPTTHLRSYPIPPRVALGLAVCALIIALGWVVPVPPLFTPASWHALVALATIVPLLGLAQLPEGVGGLILVAAWVLGGVAPATVALSGFSSATWILLVGIMAVGAAISNSGLLYRISLAILARGGRRFAGQVTALMAAGLLVGPAMPNAAARVTVIAPVTEDLADALGYPVGSRRATGLAFAILTGFGLMVGPFLTSSSTALLTFALLPEPARSSVTWMSWAVRAAVPHTILLVGVGAFIVWYFGREARRSSPAGAPGQSVLGLEQALLGRWTRQEKIAGVVAVTLMAGFVSQPLHHVDLAWLAMAALASLAIFGLITADVLRSLNWNFILFFGVVSSFSKVFDTAGLSTLLTQLIQSHASLIPTNALLFVGLLVIISLASTFLFQQSAGASIIVIALSGTALAAGINPWVVAVIATVACNWFLVPYQATVYLAMRENAGDVFTPGQGQIFAVAFGFLLLIAFCASVPIWHLLGLL